MAREAEQAKAKELEEALSSEKKKGDSDVKLDDASLKNSDLVKKLEAEFVEQKNTIMK